MEFSPRIGKTALRGLRSLLDVPLAILRAEVAKVHDLRIVESCLDRWTLDMLDEELRRTEWDESWVHTRGSVLQRVFSHDAWHCAELSETLGNAGLPQIDLWD